MNLFRKIFLKAIGKNKTRRLPQSPMDSYYFAMENPCADIGLLQGEACKDYLLAYHFAKNVPGADIVYCQRVSLQDPFCGWAYVKYIQESNIEWYYKTYGDYKAYSYYKNEFEDFILNRL